MRKSFCILLIFFSVLNLYGRNYRGFHFKNTPIIEACEIISKKSGLNIMIDSNISLSNIKVNFFAPKISGDKALELIVKYSGLSLKKVDTDIFYVSLNKESKLVTEPKNMKEKSVLTDKKSKVKAIQETKKAEREKKKKKLSLKQRLAHIRQRILNLKIRMKNSNLSSKQQKNFKNKPIKFKNKEVKKQDSSVVKVAKLTFKPTASFPPAFLDTPENTDVELTTVKKQIKQSDLKLAKVTSKKMEKVKDKIKTKRIFIKKASKEKKKTIKKSSQEKAVYSKKVKSQAVILPGQMQKAYQRANSYFEKGKYKAALDIYKEIASARPGFGEIYYRLGMTYKALGRIDKARLAFEIALTLAPDNKLSRFAGIDEKDIK